MKNKVKYTPKEKGIDVEIELTKDHVVTCSECNSGRIRIWYYPKIDKIKMTKSCTCDFEFTSEFLITLVEEVLPKEAMIGSDKNYIIIGIAKKEYPKVYKMAKELIKGRYPCVYEIPFNITGYCPARTTYKMEPETLRDYCRMCPYLEKYEKLIQYYSTELSQSMSPEHTEISMSRLLEL